LIKPCGVRLLTAQGASLPNDGVTNGVLQATSNLAASAWQPVTNGLGQSGGQNTVTNPGSGNPRFFRLRFTY
jgi:hypothetical protein